MNAPVPVAPARRRRAMFFDATEYSTATLREYNATAEKYEVFAKQQGFDPLFPDPLRLSSYFEMVQQTGSARAARRAAPALAHYFRSRGAPNLIAHPEVDATLFGPMAEQTSLDGVLLHRRAQYYADRAKSEETVVMQTIAVRHYLGFAAHHGFDAKHPPVGVMYAYLCDLGKTRSGRTVRARANAIAQFLRVSGVDDVVHTPIVQDLIVGLVRTSVSRQHEPLFAEDLQRLFRTLSDERLMDIRDRLLLLCFAFAGMTSQLVMSLDRARIKVDEHGVTFYTDAPRRPRIYVGGVDEAGLDIRVAMRRWLRIIGTDSGPLFPKTHPRGGFTNIPLGRESFRRILQRLIIRTGLRGRFTTISLRKGLAIRVNSKRGPVLAARAAGYSMTALRNIRRSWVRASVRCKRDTDVVSVAGSRSRRKLRANTSPILSNQSR